MGRTKAKVAARKQGQLLLLVVSVVALAAIVVWQSSSTVAGPTPAAAVQLKPVTVPAPSSDLVVAAPSKVASPAPFKDSVSAAPTNDKAPATKAKTTKAPPTTAPVVAKRNDPPAATTVARSENVVPPAAPKANKSPAAEYEAMARVSLQNKDYDQARQHIGSALAYGGKATFMIIHDHSRGNFDKDDPKATCVGELTIDADEVRFEPREEADRFAANWADVREAGGNRFFGSGRGGFHVTVNADGKYKNFNLAPESKDKAEGKLILDLLNAYARKSDRTK